MLIRMDDMNAAPDLDPMSRLDNLVQKARSYSASKRAVKLVEPMPSHKQAADLDFSDPKIRENFLNSLQTRTVQETEAETHHGLDPERVAALLDLE